jgi:aminoglycoside phosphotransferase (APT) family kinase protein
MPEGATAGRVRIGEGREADIFALDKGRVLRLLRRSSDPKRVEREATAMRAAADGGVDVPNVYGTTMVDGRAGLIMDRVDGPDLIALTGKRPWTVPRIARIVGRAQARMHEVVAPDDLPNLRQLVRWKIETASELPAELADFALKKLDALPDGDRLCHGDFHPGNVLVGRDGPAVIDWTDASRGDPAADLARTRLLLRQGAVPEPMPALIRYMQAFGRGAFFRLYLRACTRAHPSTKASSTAGRSCGSPTGSWRASRPSNLSCLYSSHGSPTIRHKPLSVLGATLEGREKRLASVAFAPRLVPASGDADVLELWDVGEKRVPNHGAGVWVVVAVQHQHGRLDRVERRRL